MPQLTLKGIQRRIQALMVQATKLKQRNKTPALKQVVRLMRKNDLSIGEVRAALQGRQKPGATRKVSRKRKPQKVKAKYENPATGETWSGRGRAARWITEAEKAGRKRNEFLVKRR